MNPNRARHVVDAASHVGLELRRGLSAANATPEQGLRNIRVIRESTQAEVMKVLSGMKKRDTHKGFFGRSSFTNSFEALVAEKVENSIPGAVAGGARITRTQAMVEAIDELYGGLILRSDLANLNEGVTGDGVLPEINKYLSGKLDSLKFSDLEGRPALRVALSSLNMIAGVGRRQDAARRNDFIRHSNELRSINQKINEANSKLETLGKLNQESRDFSTSILGLGGDIIDAERKLLELRSTLAVPAASRTGLQKSFISNVIAELRATSEDNVTEKLVTSIADMQKKLSEEIAKIPAFLDKLQSHPELQAGNVATAISQFRSSVYSPNKGNPQNYLMILNGFADLFGKTVAGVPDKEKADTAVQDAKTNLSKESTALATAVEAKNKADNAVKAAKTKFERENAELKDVQARATQAANNLKTAIEIEKRSSDNLGKAKKELIKAQDEFDNCKALVDALKSATPIDNVKLTNAQNKLSQAERRLDGEKDYEKRTEDVHNEDQAKLTTASTESDTANSDLVTARTNADTARKSINTAEDEVAKADTAVEDAKAKVRAAEEAFEQANREGRLSLIINDTVGKLSNKCDISTVLQTTIDDTNKLLSNPAAPPALGLIQNRDTEIAALNRLRASAAIPYDVERLVMERIFVNPPGGGTPPLPGSLSDEELAKRILIEVNRINYWNTNPENGLGGAHPSGNGKLPGSFDPSSPATAASKSYTDDQLAQLAERQILEGRNELKRTGNFAERMAGINNPRLREMLAGKLALTPQLRAMGIKNTRTWAKMTLQEKIEKSEGKFSTSFKQRVLGMKFIKDSAKGEESPFEGLDTSDLNNWESIERSLASGILSVESAFYLLAALKDFFAGSPFDGESDVNIMENLSNYLYERVFEEVKAKAATETPVPSTVEIEKRANAEFKKRVMGSEKTTKAWLSHYDKNSKDVENNFVKNLNARFKVLKLNYANGKIDSVEFDRQYNELVDEARERNALKLVDFYSNRRGIGAIFNGFAGGRLKWMGPLLQKTYSRVANAGVKPTVKLALDAARGVKGFAGATMKGAWGLIWNPIRLVGLTTAGLYNSFADPDDKIKDAAGQTLGVSQALGATLADIKGAGSYFVGAARGVKGSLIGSEVDGKNGFLGDFVGGWKSLKEDREKALEKAEKKLKKAEELMNIGPLDLTGSAPRKAVEAPAPVAQAPAVPEVKAPESASAEDLKKVEDYLPTLPKHAIAPLSSMLTSVRTGKKAEAEAYAKVLLAKSIPQEVVNYLQVLTEDQVKQIHKKMTDLKLIGDKKVKSEESAAKAA